MSSEEKSKTEEKKKSDKEKAKAKAKAKDEAKNKSKTSSGGGNKKATTVAEIKAEEYSTFIKSSVSHLICHPYDPSTESPQVVSHAGWLSTPLQNISPSLSLSIPQFSLILLSLFTLLLLLSPSGWIPHISSPIVLLIPLQNTLLAITHEKRNPKHTARTKGSGDECIQWIVFWVGWIMLGWVGESIRVFKPGWRGIWEIGKVGVGIVLAGPWFSRDALVCFLSVVRGSSFGG